MKLVPETGRVVEGIGGRLLLLSTLATFLSAPSQSAQGLQDNALEIAERGLEPAPPQSEGPLQNDAFLPNAAEAGVLLARGDASLARSRTLQTEGAAGEAQRALTAALDDWFNALQTGGGEASVFPDPSSPGPLTEGLCALGLRSFVVRRSSCADSLLESESESGVPPLDPPAVRFNGPR